MPAPAAPCRRKILAGAHNHGPIIKIDDDHHQFGVRFRQGPDSLAIQYSSYIRELVPAFPDSGHRLLVQPEQTGAGVVDQHPLDAQPDGPVDLTWYRERGLRANAAASSGYLELAERIEARAAEAAPNQSARHPFAAAGAMVLMHRDGDIVRARSILLNALEEEEAIEDPAVFNTILAALMQSAQMRSDASWWAQARAIADENAEAVDPLIDLALRTYAHEVPPDRASLLADQRVIDAALTGGEPWKLVILMLVAVHMVTAPERAQLLDRLIPVASSYPAMDVVCSFHLTAKTRRSGALADARERGEKAFASATKHGLNYWATRLQGQLAIIAAVMGEKSAAQQHAALALSWALPRGLRIVIDDASHAQSLLALADGEFEEAHSILVSLPMDPDRWLTSSYGMAEAMDLAEACQRIGRPGDAQGALDAFAEASKRSGAPQSGFFIGATGAILEADAESAIPRFRRALAMESAIDSPLELARLRLALAHALHTAGADPIETRGQLRLAASTFRLLGANGWAERAERESAALDHTADHPPHLLSALDDHVRLTKQERSVVLLAAEGLTNKEIGLRLFLSDRTVAFHLYNAFPKLGVTSRAGLRDALNGPDDSSREGVVG